MQQSDQSATRLRHEIQLRQYFFLSFGSIVGVGWIVAVGAWLSQAGSAGAILGFGLGALLMTLVALCYAEAAALFPVSGGEVAYTFRMFGTRAAYFCGWFLAMSYIAVVAFEAIGLGWILSAMFPQLQSKVIYVCLGSEVYLHSLLSGLFVMALISAANLLGIKVAVRLQEIASYLFLVAITYFVGGALWVGDFQNLSPAFSSSAFGSPWVGVLAVASTAPFWFAGFDVVPQAMGERSDQAQPRRVGMIVALSISAAFLFYVLIIFSTAILLPRDDILQLSLPAKEAFDRAFQSTQIGNTVLFAGIMGLITTWNAVFLAATRVLFALGRAHLLPSAFGRLNKRYGTPTIAILFVCAVASAATLLGSGAISVITSSASVTYGIVFSTICFGLLRYRKTNPHLTRPFSVSHWPILPVMAGVGSLSMSLFALADQVRDSVTGPIGAYVLAIWAVLGVAMWRSSATVRARVSDKARDDILMNE